MKCHPMMRLKKLKRVKKIASAGSNISAKGKKEIYRKMARVSA